jgi:class 3 adenylate cyclase
VTTAARLEALAVPGSICVSENFAAVMAMTPMKENQEFSCDYVGRATSQKEETEFPLYRLRKTAG